MKKQTRKRYTPEYKVEAIALVNDQGFSIGEAGTHGYQSQYVASMAQRA